MIHGETKSDSRIIIGSNSRGGPSRERTGKPDMTWSEMNHLLAMLLPREQAGLAPPSDADWEALGTKFRCTFSDDFRNFISLMATYCLPGDVFNVSSGRTNGNDLIHLVYDLEAENNSHWDSAMIPFYGIGNGDYFCLNKIECPHSRVYYYYHDLGITEVYCNSFEDWIKGLPGFLG